MLRNIQHTINLAVSVNGYNAKPAKLEFSRCYYEYRELTQDELVKCVFEGRIFVHNFKIVNGSKDGQFVRTLNQRDCNFLYSNCLFVDVDDSPLSFNEFISKLDKKPSIAYTTFSNGVKGNRYRLVYMLTDRIESKKEFKKVMKGLVGYIRVYFPDFKVDNCCYNPTQPMYGTYSLNNNDDDDEKPKPLKYVSESYYSKNDFLPYYNEEEGENKKVSSSSNREESKRNYEKKVSDRVFVNEFLNLDLYDKDAVKAFLKKYSTKYPYFYQTKLEGMENPDIPYFILPDKAEDYQCIHRIFGVEDGKLTIKKVPIGSRKRIMYISCQLRKVMKKDVTPEHLLYCLIFDLTHYFDLSNKDIELKDIYDTAFNAYNDPITIELKKDDRKFIVNGLYCEKYNKTKKQIQLLARREMNDVVIGECYDFSVSVKENLKNLKELGLKVSQVKLYRFVKEYNQESLTEEEIDEYEFCYSPNEDIMNMSYDTLLSQFESFAKVQPKPNTDDLSNFKEAVKETKAIELKPSYPKLNEAEIEAIVVRLIALYQANPNPDIKLEDYVSCHINDNEIDEFEWGDWDGMNAADDRRIQRNCFVQKYFLTYNDNLKQIEMNKEDVKETKAVEIKEAKIEEKQPNIESNLTNIQEVKKQKKRDYVTYSEVNPSNNSEYSNTKAGKKRPAYIVVNKHEEEVPKEIVLETPDFDLDSLFCTSKSYSRAI